MLQPHARAGIVKSQPSMTESLGALVRVGRAVTARSIRGEANQKPENFTSPAASFRARDRYQGCVSPA